MLYLYKVIIYKKKDIVFMKNIEREMVDLKCVIVGCIICFFGN